MGVVILYKVGAIKCHTQFNIVKLFVTLFTEHSLAKLEIKSESHKIFMLCGQ